MKKAVKKPAPKVRVMRPSTAVTPKDDVTEASMETKALSLDFHRKVLSGAILPEVAKEAAKGLVCAANSVKNAVERQKATVSSDKLNYTQAQAEIKASGRKNLSPGRLTMAFKKGMPVSDFTPVEEVLAS